MACRSRGSQHSLGSPNEPTGGDSPATASATRRRGHGRRREWTDRSSRREVRRGLARLGAPQDRPDDARRRPPGVHLCCSAGPPPARTAAADRVPGRPQIVGAAAEAGVPRPTTAAEPGLADVFSEFETARGGIWRICAVIDYATKSCLAATVTPTSYGQDALGCLRWAVVEAERVLDLDDLRGDRGVMDVVDADDYVIGEAPAAIAVVTDNGPWVRGVTFADAFAGEVYLFRHTYNTLRPHQALDDTHHVRLTSPSNTAGSVWPLADPLLDWEVLT